MTFFCIVKEKPWAEEEGDIHAQILPFIHRSCLLSFDNEKLSTYVELYLPCGFSKIQTAPQKCFTESLCDAGCQH